MYHLHSILYLKCSPQNWLIQPNKHLIHTLLLLLLVQVGKNLVKIKMSDFLYILRIQNFKQILKFNFITALIICKSNITLICICKKDYSLREFMCSTRNIQHFVVLLTFLSLDDMDWTPVRCAWTAAYIRSWKQSFSRTWQKSRILYNTLLTFSHIFFLKINEFQPIF